MRRTRTAGVPVSLAWQGLPSPSNVAARVFSVPPIVVVLDAYGNVVPVDGTAINLLVTLNATTTVLTLSTVAGVAAYNGFALNKTGNYSLEATTTSLTSTPVVHAFVAGKVFGGWEPAPVRACMCVCVSACMSTHACVSVRVSVRACVWTDVACSCAVGPPSQLVLTIPPSSNNRIDTPFDVQPVVRVEDAGGNLVDLTGPNATVRVRTGEALNGITTVPFVHGVASFASLSLNQTGAFILDFSSSPGIFYASFRIIVRGARRKVAALWARTRVCAWCVCSIYHRNGLAIDKVCDVVRRGQRGRRCGSVG